MTDDTTAIVRQLLAREVPEIASGDVEIKAVSRRIGYRWKVALRTRNETVDPIAACVGVRGSRIKKVVDALQGERIDLVRWHDDIKTLIANSLVVSTLAWQVTLLGTRLSSKQRDGLLGMKRNPP